MRFGLSLVALSLLSTGLPAAPPAARPTHVDVVLCLDTSNSMDGLIDSAKRKLWAVVNDLAKIDPAPTLRVALYSYGNDTYDAKAGWVRKDLDLTGDLDAVYKQLFALTTKGGTEFVARVTRDALAGLKWADDKDALKILFVCGNEPADQDKEVTLDSVAREARAKGVVVNTIYCRPANHPEAAGWRAFAELAGGKYANIDQDRARTEVTIKTPFDDDIRKLGVKINDTYCWYGRQGAEAAANQKAQDTNAEKTAGDAATERGVTKAGKLYRNATCDLIDRMEIDKDFDLTKIKDDDLPDELKKLKPEERLPHLKKKADERAAIQKQVAELNVKRAKFIEDEKKKQPRSEAEKAFDDALRAILRDQAAAKGMKVKE
jgi:von Willebrand factor type A domain